MRGFLLTFLMAATAFAEPETAAEWASVLNERLNEQPGFLAQYHSSKSDAELKGIIGLDRESGVGFTRFDIEKGGDTITGKFWSVENGDYFIDAMGTRGFFPGWIPELEAMKKLFPGTDMKRGYATPALILSKDSVELGFQIGLSASESIKVAWFRAASEGELGEVTPDTVSFETKEYGTLIVDRKNGLLRKQITLSPTGEKIVLHLDDVEIDPGKEALVDISSGWRVAGAKSMLDPGFLAGLRQQLFQQIVKAVEEDKMPMSGLEELLALPALIELCREIGKLHPDLLTPEPIVKTALRGIKSDAEKLWHKKAPGSEKSDLMFLRYFNSERFRDTIATKLTESHPSVPEKAENAMLAIFAKNPPFEESGDLSRQAIEKIQTAMVLAFYQAPIYSTMTELWGEPEEDTDSEEE